MLDKNHELPENGVPYGIRTRVAAVKGQRPRPLDEGDLVCSYLQGVSPKIKKEICIEGSIHPIKIKISRFLKTASGLPWPLTGPRNDDFIFKNNKNVVARSQRRRSNLVFKFSLMKHLINSILKSLIYAYRTLISPFLRPRCRFLPTCSEYALDALHRFGPYKGSILALKRVCRCHPWGGHGFDPVKEE